MAAVQSLQDRPGEKSRNHQESARDARPPGLLREAAPYREFQPRLTAVENGRRNRGPGRFDIRKPGTGIGAGGFQSLFLAARALAHPEGAMAFSRLGSASLF